MGREREGEGDKRLQERGEERERKVERELMAPSYSKLRDDMKASPRSIYHKKNTVRVCVCVSDCTVASLASFLCVFMSVSLCNYSHSSPHNSYSCRFCQVDIQALVINNSVRFVWPARRSACF